MPDKMPFHRRITSPSSSSTFHPPIQQCTPIILLLSFLLYLNFALLGHLTITDRHPRSYYREYFPFKTDDVRGIKRSEVSSSEQQQQQMTEEEEETDNDSDKEDKSRQWQLEGRMEEGKRERQKQVPASFYRSESSMVDVNKWWKTIEQKVQSRQKKQMKDNDTENNNIIVDNNNDNSKRGQIALIMSYPNSGTSFTSKLVRQATGTTTATNYGMEGLISTTDHKSVPVYNYSLDGPYWLHPPTQAIDDGNDIDGEDKLQTKREVRPIPPVNASILTKTHCGIRCTHCPPIMYVESEETFFQRCLSGSRKVPDKNKNNKLDYSTTSNNNGGGKMYYKKEFVTYSPKLIHSTIHLIRNPFDNAISRFHHELKEHAKHHSKYKSWMERYPRNPKGFRKWCNDENTMYGTYERMQFNWTEHGYSSDITRYFEGVSCHAEMVRYALWHALALRTSQRLDVPIMYIYYEDYAVDLEGETNKLLHFLNLTRTVDEEGKEVELPEFRQSDYSEYFTLEERAAASDLIRRVVRDERGIVELLDRYFTEWNFEKLINQTQDII